MILYYVSIKFIYNLFINIKNGLFNYFKCIDGGVIWYIFVYFNMDVREVVWYFGIGYYFYVVGIN